MSKQYHITENFVERKVHGLMDGATEKLFRDSKTTGFALRARKGAKGLALTYFAIYDDGRKMSIGAHGVFTADTARAEAQRILQTAAGGDDPKSLRAEKKSAPTIEQLWELFETEHLALKEPSTRKDYAGRYRRIILPTFKGRKVKDITRAEIAAMKLKFKHKKTDLNRALAVLSKMFSHAMLHDIRTDNPCAKLPRFTETVNDTWLDETQLPAFIAALMTRTGPVADLIKFITVSGWRISAARLLRWDQVNLKRMEVRLGDKATKITATALSSDGATIIAAQAHKVGFVFSNSTGRMPVSYKDVLAMLEEICKEAEIPRIGPHRLRATIATHSAIDGANVAELMQAYGWKTPAMAMRYVKKSESLARKGVERGANVINLFGKENAEIVKIKH
ncbi:tyrosine-type recombinase/integrase [Sinorhizobium mexicanum]|uniref:Phage integrase family protein n=1 Tax=Sinorhizobium mexicanum TaxID=375549 RepID=A0A859QWI5_9HYPH|nr:tyrosine-type recombinase/integrase [Sinorhizobium mexicanum]MBP1881954.1 integrase [Sinorhizobium mexicanum]QLL61688.1 phage integrase family protein [Sinorhizobium mexicanum]